MFFAIVSLLWDCLNKWLVENTKTSSWWFMSHSVIIEKHNRAYHLRFVSWKDRWLLKWWVIHQDPEKNDEETKAAEYILKVFLVSCKYPEWDLKKSILSWLKKIDDEA